MSAPEAIRAAARPITESPRDYDPLLELVGDARIVLLGHATVWLEGEKLRGGYTLQRIGSGEEERWLVIKRKDEGADARRNPANTEAMVIDKVMRAAGLDPDAVGLPASGRTGQAAATGRSGRSMSQQNVEIVRRACDAWMETGKPSLEVLDPEIEWDTTHFEGWPESKVYRGRVEVSRFLDEWLASWGSYEASVDELLEIEAVDLRVEPDELISVGDKVIAPVRMVARGSASEIPLAAAVTWVWTFGEDGLVIRVEAFESREEALRAAGAPG